MTARRFQVTTDRGRTLTVVETQLWIDTSDKSGESRMPGRKEVRLADGSGLAFDGERFSLPNGEGFTLKDLPPE